MAKAKPEYEVVEEFGRMANRIVAKYPDLFYGVNVDEIRCVKIINKSRPVTKNTLWQLEAVKMPIRLDCRFGWYITLFADDWDEMDERHKLLLVAEILHGVPTNKEDEGKVNSFDTKGYATMFRTFKTIDYLSESNVPHILKEDVNWVKL